MTVSPNSTRAPRAERTSRTRPEGSYPWAPGANQVGLGDPHRDRGPTRYPMPMCSMNCRLAAVKKPLQADQRECSLGAGASRNSVRRVEHQPNPEPRALVTRTTHCVTSPRAARRSGFTGSAELRASDRIWCPAFEISLRIHNHHPHRHHPNEPRRRTRLPAAAHRVHHRTDRIRPGQVRRAAHRLGAIPRTLDQRPRPRQCAPGDAGRRRDRSRGRDRGRRCATVRRPGGCRLAGRDHPQPGDDGRVLRRRPA